MRIMKKKKQGPLTHLKVRHRGRRQRRLTQLEVRHDGGLLLRVTVANDKLTSISSELGVIIKKISPGAPTGITEPELQAPDLVISSTHADDDETYHAAVREHFAVLFNALCDASLADALQIARTESARRDAGRN